MLGSGYRIRRWARRSAGQLAVSVLATVAASAIYGGLRHGFREIEAPPAPPPVTSGGKLAARVEGAAATAFDPPGPRLPLLSVVNWTAPVAAADWSGSQAAGAPVQPKVARLARPARHGGAEVATLVPPVPPADLRTETRPAPAAARSENMVFSAAGSVVAALDTAAGAVTATARGALASGGALLGHLVP